MTAYDDFVWLQEELAKYSNDFRSTFDYFSGTYSSEFSERYQKIMSNDTQVLIYTLTNGQETTLNLSFSDVMTRIPVTIFYVSTIQEKSTLNLQERNLYELMLNLLNGYYKYIKELTLILVEDAVKSSKTSIIATILFFSSFVLSIVFLFIVWKLFSIFVFE